MAIKFPSSMEESKYESRYEGKYLSNPIERAIEWVNLGPTSDLSVVDCGCGNGELIQLCKFREYLGLDISHKTVSELNSSLGSDSISFEWSNLVSDKEWGYIRDISFCINVLEHIPPLFVGRVIKYILSASEKALISVTCRPSNFFCGTGENLHLTIKSYKWWKYQIDKIGVIERSDMIGYDAIFLCHQKKTLFPDSLAIVGNSGSELGSGNGDLIDRHNHVIRFNNFSIDRRYQKDYGSKTTDWACSFYSDIRIREEEFQRILCPLPVFDPKWRGRYRYFYPIVEIRDKIISIPVEYFDDLVGYVEYPSTGLALLYWVYRDRGYINPEDSFGFSFFSSDFKHHYFDEDTEYRHSNEFESNFYNSMLLGLI